MSDVQGVARDQLRAFIERIERLEEEKKTIADDIKDVYGEAKGMGFDTKILKRVVALRKKDEQERTEEEMILDTYLAALGMIPQFEMFEREEVKPVSRDERRRQFMSEDMADHKVLIDEMADLGMISEEARKENKALADAVAAKFGNGPLSNSSGSSPAGPTPLAARGANESAVSNSPETANETVGGFPVAAAPTNAEKTGAIPSTRQGTGMERGMDPGVTGGESAAPNSDHEAVATVATALPSAERVTPHRSGSAAANTGGDHVTDTASPDPHRAGALVKQSAPAINERCQNVGKCPFSHHPNKIVCSPCQKAWDSRKVAVPA